MKDLIILAADRDIEAGLKGLLARPLSLGISAVQYETFTHPRRDPGCYHEAHTFLRSFNRQYSHGLIVFDSAWDGAPSQSSQLIEAGVRQRLDEAGMGRWADVVVIEPEIEAWVWSDSPHVDDCLGWREQATQLRDWLRVEQLWLVGDMKPRDPKLAFEKAIRKAKVRASSAIYERLAGQVSLERCADASFRRLRTILTAWFPAVPA